MNPYDPPTGMDRYDPTKELLAVRLQALLPKLSFPGLTFETSFEMTLEGSLRSSRHFLRVCAAQDSPLAVNNTSSTCKLCHGDGEVFMVGSLGSRMDRCWECAGVGSIPATQSFPWKGRKWRLSKHMTDGEIVQTAFLAVMTAMEHEVREKFTYKGVSVFDPHYDIEKLVQLRSSGDALKERG